MLEWVGAWNESPGDRGGLRRDFAALISPGARYAFNFFKRIANSGRRRRAVGLTAAAPDIGVFFIFVRAPCLGKEIVTNEDEKHRSHNQRADEKDFPPQPGGAKLSDVSLPEVHGSMRCRNILVSGQAAGVLRSRLPVAVGYMDPGNWRPTSRAIEVRLHAPERHSDFEPHGDSLQSLCAKLGIVTGRDLAQACRDHLLEAVAFRCGSCAKSPSARATCGSPRLGHRVELLFHIPLIAGVCTRRSTCWP